MPNDCLYLHELIDIVGTGSEAYKRHTGTRRPSGPAGTLVGTFQQSGSTGAWPVVVNLWEMAGWDGWAEILEYQYDERRAGQPPALRRWWTAAAKLRSGGFDRVLEPAPFCPTRQQLIDRGVRGPACRRSRPSAPARPTPTSTRSRRAGWRPPRAAVSP
jgi:hypothetical protein